MFWWYFGNFGSIMAILVILMVLFCKKKNYLTCENYKNIKKPINKSKPPKRPHVVLLIPEGCPFY